MNTTFETDGLLGWGMVKKGRSRQPAISEEKIAEIVELTAKTVPPGHTHWTCRSMAKRVGSVRRRCSGSGSSWACSLMVDTFKVSNDPRFAEKLVDVVGLSLDPPEKAIVLCMDEKSSVQALDRTQASLPFGRGRAGQ